MPNKLLAAACAAALCVALAIPLVASGATKLTTHLTAGQVVNPNGGDPGATASVKLKVNRVKQRICFRIEYRGLEDVTGSHLHKGDRGEIARPIVTLFEGNRASPVKGCVRDVRKRIVKRLKRKPEKHYLDIDTRAYPDGAVRGQLK
jgi:hypothetical protein